MASKCQMSLFDAPEPPRLPDTIGPASVSASTIHSVLQPGRGSTAGFDYTLNAYRGCTFGCAYCFATSFEARPDYAENWGKWVEVKTRALESLVGVDLRGKTIFMSSVTDPYQPLEAKLRLTRQVVERLLEDQATLIVQTRSPLVVRDSDLMSQFETGRVNLSIPTDDDEMRRRYEPNAPSIPSRLRTIRTLKDRGLRAAICISPMIPIKSAREFAERLNDSGADMVTASWFHHSERAFSSTTRKLALDHNQIQGWTYDDFAKACSVLQERCKAWTGPKFAFGP